MHFYSLQGFLKRIIFNSTYFIYWLCYFFILKGFFLLYYLDKTVNLNLENLLLIPFYGLRLDISATAFICAPAYLMVAISVFLKNKVSDLILRIYTGIMLLAVTLLALFDLGLYGPWGVRLDATPLTYLNTPSEMLASVSKLELSLGTIAWLGISFLFYQLFKKAFRKTILLFPKAKIYQSALLLIFVPALIIPARGGLQTIPINQSNVYFSDQMFANHASVNFAWSFLTSMIDRDFDDNNPYLKLDKTLAQNAIKKANLAIKDSVELRSNQILKYKKPNIILIVWESLTAKIVASLGGEKDVTSNFNKLTKEGILFTNFYANGDRSDKGMTAILSGYYPQPDKSIIKHTNKIRNLPILSSKMYQLGYHSQFYYGGDLNFGNMNTYLRTGGINDFISKKNFDKKDWYSKWGVHDQAVFNRFIDEHKTKKEQPFFDFIFTLSSHEPFEFPGEYKFGKDTKDNQFRSAHAFTDKAFGEFINTAKQQWWWDNTLIVVMADHGHHRPELDGVFNTPSKFHIPMLWLGGALDIKDTTIENYGSQVDFSKTLLELLNSEGSDFVWSNNLFTNSKNHYVIYVFNKGFGALNQNGVIIYDYNIENYLIQNGKHMSYLDTLGKSIIQESYQDFLNRK